MRAMIKVRLCGVVFKGLWLDINLSSQAGKTPDCCISTHILHWFYTPVEMSLQYEAAAGVRWTVSTHWVSVVPFYLM